MHIDFVICVTNDIIYHCGFIKIPQSALLQPEYGHQELLQIPDPSSVDILLGHASGSMSKTEYLHFPCCNFSRIRTRNASVLFHTLIPASFCGPFMYSYCSVFSSKPNPLPGPEKIHKNIIL